MVEGHALIEWSPEVGLALCSRFCSWVVQEDDAENDAEETIDGKSSNMRASGTNSFSSMQLNMDKSERAASNNSAMGARNAATAETVYRSSS